MPGVVVRRNFGNFQTGFSPAGCSDIAMAAGHVCVLRALIVRRVQPLRRPDLKTSLSATVFAWVFEHNGERDPLSRQNTRYLPRLGR